MADSGNSAAPSAAVEALFVKSEEVPQGSRVVRGYDFNLGLNYPKLFQSYINIGFQAHHLGMAVEEIQRMLEMRKVPLAEKKEYLDEECRPRTSCTIFLGFTSNMISCGIREIIRFLVEHAMVDCLVTTCGGIEEDIIKCMGDFYIGSFNLKGSWMRSKGFNRTGNLIVPNNNYCSFEDWLCPILDKMLEEQQNEGTNWTPSKMIHRFGKEINDTNSVYYWAYKNNIPVFCPAITDGAIGDCIYCHSYKNPGLRVDIAEDIVKINNLALFAANTGIIILGGGVMKHHICNANLTRNGAEFAVYINTANEYDGSDAGASPDEAVSWGKIKGTAKPVKVNGDASLIFPILVGETFAKDYYTSKEKTATSTSD